MKFIYQLSAISRQLSAGDQFLVTSAWGCLKKEPGRSFLICQAVFL